MGVIATCQFWRLVVMMVWLQTKMELVCTFLIYHSVKKSYEHMLWCSNTSADGAVGTYSQTPSQTKMSLIMNSLSREHNNFMHYVL